MASDPLNEYVKDIRRRIRHQIAAAVKAGRIPDFRAEYQKALEEGETEPEHLAALGYLAMRARAQ